jgi:hypothetical protein
MLLVKLHAICGTLGLLLICGFFLSTVGAELSGSIERIVAVKTWILQLIPLLVVLLACAGAGGNRIARGWRSVSVDWKRLRMAAAGFIGVFVLIPCAFTLQAWAEAGEFTWRFHAVQGTELLAGAGNIALLSLNLRDGLRLRRMGKGR